VKVETVIETSPAKALAIMNEYQFSSKTGAYLGHKVYTRKGDPTMEVWYTL
jgi:hypothetical protein